MQCLERIVSLSESCRQVPWRDEDVEALVSHLRALRAVFVDSSCLGETDVNQKDCTQILIALSSILSFLLNSESRNFLDRTEGQYHLVVSVLIQCLVNCLSHMAQHKMHVSGEVTATLITSLAYSATIRDWVFSLNFDNSLPLWRIRIGCYAFILITTLITSVQQSGIPSDFTTFLLLAVRVMKVISVNGGGNVQLLQAWFDHCISLIGSLCTLPPSEEYWKHKTRRQERAIELCAALGTILLLYAYEEQLGGLETPSMKKLAELCVTACLPGIKASYELWIDMMISILGHCVSKSPFKLNHEEEYNVKFEPLSVALPDDDSQQMLAILRGGVYLTLNLLPPIQSTDSTLQPAVATGDRLTTLIFTIGDVLVIVDSLLQVHLATRATIAVGRKAPSLMDSMGAFSFTQPQSICFAAEIKQDLIRSLLSMVHTQPLLVASFVKHSRVTHIECISSTSSNEVTVNAPDIFWALINASQRDPASPLAVEWTIVLLGLLFKPVIQSDEVLQAAAIMSQRIAELKPSATLREQLKSIPNIQFPD
ncbi:hypothetical protein TSMEX_009053 [Taenia solium]|eukprot:TsM_000038300 transcript=TsM_000038300 gene=TsM_000038300